MDTEISSRNLNQTNSPPAFCSLLLYSARQTNDLVDKSGVTIVVPDSPCAVGSHTSNSIQQIAQGWGWTFERRTVPYMCLPDFSEVLGVGTAVGVVPVRSITRKNTAKRLTLGPRVLASSDDSETVVYIPDGEQGDGPVFRKLLTSSRAIQRGMVSDDFSWRCEVQARDKELSDVNESLRQIKIAANI